MHKKLILIPTILSGLMIIHFGFGICSSEAHAQQRIAVSYFAGEASREAEVPQEAIYFSGSGHAEFTSRVPLHTFTGESGHLTGMYDPKENILDFYLDLSTLETGIGRRDRDMFRTLQVEEFPFAEFTGSLGGGFDFGSSEKQAVVARGEFTIHGVTREVSIEGAMQLQGENIQLEAEWVLLLDDYDIEPPGILFYRVNEEQELRIKVTLRPHNREEFSNNN